MTWESDQVNGVMWVSSEAAKSLCGSMEKVVGIKFKENMTYVHNHLFEWATLEEENEKVGNFLVEKFRDKQFSKKFFKDYRAFDKETIKTMNITDKKDFSKSSNEEIFSLFESVTNTYIKNFDWGFIIEPMDYVMPNLIESRLLKLGFTNSEISDILAIADVTFANKETQKLIKIAQQPEAKQKALLKKHAYNYRWLQSAHMGKMEISFSYFEERLEEIKSKNLKEELNNLKNFRKNALLNKRKILKKYKIDKETKFLIKLSDVIAPPHDRRKELFLRTIYTLDSLREEIAKRFGYTKRQLEPFEIRDIMKLKDGKKIDKEYADKLSEQCLLYINTEKNIWKYYYGQEAKEFFEKKYSPDLADIEELKGMAASPGKVTGIVKIINGFKDINKMEKGNILVSSMTRPEIVPAMKKAAAIVTNEGGVTCHAAIISRELKIPCIIGTKFATRVFKDGDLVEVDADHGRVKILK